MSDPETKSKKKKTSKILVYSLIGLMIFIGIALSKIKKEEPPVLNEEKPSPVSVTTIAPSDARDIMIVPGILDPWFESIISAEQAGRVTSIMVKKGTRVKKGDVLMKLDDKTQKLALQRAEIALNDAKADFDRWSKLKESGSVSVDQMETMRKNKELSEVAFEEAKLNLDYCNIKAPEDGVISDRMIDLGEYVAHGTPVLELVEDKKLKLVVAIPERDVYAVKEGQELSFKVPALTDKAFTGKVIFVAPRGDKASNSFKVEIEIDNSEGALRPGCIASLSLDRAVIEDRIIVSLTSLVPVRGQYIAFVVEEDKAVKRIVRIESILGSEAVVESGLKEGDLLVTMGHRTLEDGMTIAVIE